MPAARLARYLHRIRFATSAESLELIGSELASEFPEDMATPSLLAIIALRIERRRLVQSHFAPGQETGA